MKLSIQIIYLITLSNYLFLQIIYSIDNSNYLFCSNYLFLLDWVLVGCMFLEICPFLLGCPTFWHVIVHSVHLWPLPVSDLPSHRRASNTLECLKGAALTKPPAMWKWKRESENHSVVSDSLRPCGLYCPWSSPGWNTEVGSLSLLQGIFPAHGSDLGLPPCRWILYHLSHKGSHEM